MVNQKYIDAIDHIRAHIERLYDKLDEILMDVDLLLDEVLKAGNPESTLKQQVGEDQPTK